MTIKWRSGWDDSTAEMKARAASDIECRDESLTQQHFAEDADINVIARRYGLGEGPLPPAPHDPRYYGDFTDLPDLRTALDEIRYAKQHFAALPASLRSRFSNNPANLWDFVMNPDNADEAVRLGLLAKPAPPAPPKPPTPSEEGGK